MEISRRGGALNSLLDRYRAVVDTASSVPTRAHALAGLAAVLARHGHVAESTQVLQQAREAATDVVHGSVQAHLSLAEALVAFHGPQRDRLACPLVHAALTQAETSGDDGARAEALAWAGQISIEQAPEAVSEAVAMLQQAVALAGQRHPLARSRAWAALADLHQRCGMLREAMVLVGEAVRLARRGGDPQLLLTIHRAGALRQVDEARRLLAQGPLEPAVFDDLLAVLAGVDSLAQQLAPDERRPLVALARAGVYVMTGRDRDALALHAGLLAEPVTHLSADEQRVARADRALALARCGDVAAAAEVLDTLAQQIDSVHRPLDAAVVANRLAACARVMGDTTAERRVEDLERRHWLHDEAYREHLRSVLVAARAG